MNKETLRMQLLSGVITESEYKTKLEENSTKESLNKNFLELIKHIEDYIKDYIKNAQGMPGYIGGQLNSEEQEKVLKLLNNLKVLKQSDEYKKSLNENFVGMGMIGNIFDREKTDYELAFEHFAKGTSLNEEIEEELEEGNDDLFTAKRFYKRTDNPRINILSHMNAINEIVMDMLETDIVKDYGPDERDDIYREYMKFVNAVKNLVK